MSDLKCHRAGLISIIIPTFNSGCFLAQTVESLIEQSYRHIEIIIVDDATTDQSILNLNEMIDRDDRIRVISNTGAKGACGARNCGLSSVTDFNVVQVECLYQRRLAAELCVNVASRFGQYKPKNLWEKLLLACAIERDQMDSFYAAHPSDSICARFVDLLEGFPSILRHSGFNVESGEVIRLREGGALLC